MSDFYSIVEELTERGYSRVGQITQKTNNFGQVVEVYAAVIRYE